MITRPLDLSSKLRPAPRSLDGLFFVNTGLIVLFFSLFGSQFVLAPGFSVDFRLPGVAGANANAKATTHVISVENSGQILTNDGLRKMHELEEWLVTQVRTTKAKEPLLLVRGDANVRSEVILEISSAAKRAGFVDVLWAATDPSDRKQQRGR